MNYATYFAGGDGRIACCGVDYKNYYWFSDGYADYMRHFQWAMGAIPEFAPAGADHLLRSDSVVQRVAYSGRGIKYRTFDPDATEVLRLTFKPSRVSAGTAALKQRNDTRGAGYTLQPLAGGDWIVRVRHLESGDIELH